MVKTYLITGASRGIGLEFARVLAERGERVIGAVRDPAGANALRDLGTCVRVVELDVVAGYRLDAGQDAIWLRR